VEEPSLLVLPSPPTREAGEEEEGYDGREKEDEGGEGEEEVDGELMERGYLERGGGGEEKDMATVVSLFLLLLPLFYPFSPLLLSLPPFNPPPLTPSL
jgi:hypothetical protein